MRNYLKFATSAKTMKRFAHLEFYILYSIILYALHSTYSECYAFAIA